MQALDCLLLPFRPNCCGIWCFPYADSLVLPIGWQNVMVLPRTLATKMMKDLTGLYLHSSSKSIKLPIFLHSL